MGVFFSEPKRVDEEEEEERELPPSEGDEEEGEELGAEVAYHASDEEASEEPTLEDILFLDPDAAYDDEEDAKKRAALIRKHEKVEHARLKNIGKLKQGLYAGPGTAMFPLDYAEGVGIKAYPLAPDHARHMGVPTSILQWDDLYNEVVSTANRLYEDLLRTVQKHGDELSEEDGKVLADALEKNGHGIFMDPEVRRILYSQPDIALSHARLETGIQNALRAQAAYKAVDEAVKKAAAEEETPHEIDVNQQKLQSDFQRLIGQYVARDEEEPGLVLEFKQGDKRLKQLQRIQRDLRKYFEKGAFYYDETTVPQFSASPALETYAMISLWRILQLVNSTIEDDFLQDVASRWVTATNKTKRMDSWQAEPGDFPFRGSAWTIEAAKMWVAHHLRKQGKAFTDPPDYSVVYDDPLLAMANILGGVEEARMINRDLREERLAMLAAAREPDVPEENIKAFRRRAKKIRRKSVAAALPAPVAAAKAPRKPRRRLVVEPEAAVPAPAAVQSPPPAAPKKKQRPTEDEFIAFIQSRSRSKTAPTEEDADKFVAYVREVYPPRDEQFYTLLRDEVLASGERAVLNSLNEYASPRLRTRVDRAMACTTAFLRFANYLKLKNYTLSEGPELQKGLQLLVDFLECMDVPASVGEMWLHLPADRAMRGLVPFLETRIPSTIPFKPPLLKLLERVQ